MRIVLLADIEEARGMTANVLKGKYFVEPSWITSPQRLGRIVETLPKDRLLVEYMNPATKELTESRIAMVEEGTAFRLFSTLEEALHAFEEGKG